MTSYEGYEVPLTLNFGKRIGTARIVSIDDKGITVVCEVSPEMKDLMTPKLTGKHFIGEMSFGFMPATREGDEGETS